MQTLKKNIFSPSGLTLIEILVVLVVITTVATSFSISPIVQVANAIPAAPSPTCLITADVRELISGSKFYPPSPDYYIDYYLVYLTISEISTYYKEPWMGNCDYSYAQKVQQNGAIISLAEYQKNPVLPGQKIKGYLNFGGDERFHGDFLSGVQILGKVDLPTPTLTSPVVSTISPSIQPKSFVPTDFVKLIFTFVSSFLRKLQIWK